MSKEYVVKKPNNLGLIEYRLDKKEMDYVWRCIDNKKENFKNSLAGNIDSSYVLMDRGDWFFINTIKPLLTTYADEFSNLPAKMANYSAGISHPLYMREWWVNYQKQGEFNPIHTHGGVYSFVIWMKIPFNWSDQNKKDMARTSNNPKISSFQFLYTDMLGSSNGSDYRLAPSDEGLMLFFPAALNHQVYPFYDCDEDRISVSGNIVFNTSKRN